MRRQVFGMWALLLLPIAGLGVLAIACSSGAAGDNDNDMSGEESVVPRLEPGAAEQLLRTGLETDRRSAGVLAATSYEVLRIFPAYQADAYVGVDAHVQLANVVESTGPWLFLRCRGTLQTEQQVRIRNVTFVHARVSVDGELLKFAPAPPGFDEQGRILDPPVMDPAGTTAIAIRDLRDGRTLLETDDLPSVSDKDKEASECPEGLEDD